MTASRLVEAAVDPREKTAAPSSPQGPRARHRRRRHWRNRRTTRKPSNEIARQRALGEWTCGPAAVEAIGAPERPGLGEELGQIAPRSCLDFSRYVGQLVAVGQNSLMPVASNGLCEAEIITRGSARMERAAMATAGRRHRAGEQTSRPERGEAADARIDMYRKARVRPNEQRWRWSPKLGTQRRRPCDFARDRADGAVARQRMPRRCEIPERMCPDPRPPAARFVLIVARTSHGKVQIWRAQRPKRSPPSRAAVTLYTGPEDDPRRPEEMVMQPRERAQGPTPDPPAFGGQDAQNRASRPISIRAASCPTSTASSSFVGHTLRSPTRRRD